MMKHRSWVQRRCRAQGFTLIEVLLVIAIIGILTSMSLLVLADAANSAKISRAKVQIRKINDLIMERWEEFETRAVPLKLNLDPQFKGANNVGRIRLYTLRELMRLELPDRYTDITAGPVDFKVPLVDSGGNSAPYTVNVGLNPLNQYYNQKLVVGRTFQYQGAECLYLILSSIQDEYGNGLDAFSDTEIGDADGDGMYEILDPWGTPIEFLRWAPGYSELTADFRDHWTPPPRVPTTSKPSPIQSGNPDNDPDPFDPFQSDPRMEPSDASVKNDTFRLVPLVYSAGPDRSYDVWRRDEIDFEFHDFGSGFTLIHYTSTPPMNEYLLNDPYAGMGLAQDDTPSVGFRIEWDGDQIEGYYDNIDNHFGLEE